MKMEERLTQYAAMTEEMLSRYLSCEESCIYKTIYDAVKYSALAGGKRLRPALLLEFCRVCGGEIEKALPFAAALEMIHTYSLIHDDLPCMDNDALRRGKPTNHKVFGEGMAVLAGDALLNRAFEVILDPRNTQGLAADGVLRAANQLARAAGMDGMIGGQVVDLESEGKAISLERLMLLQQLKTGCLIRVAAVIGCLLAGKSDGRTMQAAEVYGDRLGLAFQIQDDLLDIEGDSAVLGKSIGKDAQSEKSTFPALLGMERCHAVVAQLTNEAIDAVALFQDHEFLVQLAQSLASRNH